MKLLRIDAMFLAPDGQVAGELTLFDVTVSAHADRMRSLNMAGWALDEWFERAEDLTETEQRLLVGHTWPTLPLADIRAMLHEPVNDARRQLDRILAAQGKSAAAAQEQMADLELWEPTEDSYED